MNISTLILSQLEKPSGLWSVLINWFHGGIGNFGWTVFLVTILVKLIVSPLELVYLSGIYGIDPKKLNYRVFQYTYSFSDRLLTFHRMDSSHSF